MSANNPTTMADLERKYDGPIPTEELERVRNIEFKRRQAREDAASPDN
tara:strand:- start:350 stop:493 length:144 start_codon:yes stop_codon:yes gene_type:complete